MAERVWVDGPNHPDLFDGETPIRTRIPIEEVGLKVFKVKLTWYETVFVVALNESDAKDKAWKKVSTFGEETFLDHAEVKELDWEDELKDWHRNLKCKDGKTMIAKELLMQHLEETECTLTQN